MQLSLLPDDVDFELSGCGFTGSVRNTAVGFAEGWLLEFMESKLEDMAAESLVPMLERTVAGLSMDSQYMQASVEDLYFPNSGVSVTVDTGLKQRHETADCVQAYDEGEPGREQGAIVANLQSAGSSDLNIAFILGRFNEGLYAVWRRGFMCFDDEILWALGVDLDLAQVGALLPGFPPGTEFSMEVRTTDYPRVKAENLEGLDLTVEMRGVEVDIHGDRPDGARNTLHVEIELEASGQVVVTPANNAGDARPTGAVITHMLMDDERKATGEGYDVARIKQLVHNHILPKLLSETEPIAVTGAVYALAENAVILREMGSNKAYMHAGVDLYRRPENDSSAPDTQLTAPTAVVNPSSALVALAGHDEEVPTELLQYQIEVDGQARPLSFLRDFKVGEAGRSQAYEVSVAAVDLAGNVDPTPATATVFVDGIVPFVMVKGQRTRSADEGAVKVEWKMSDDLSGSDELAVRVEIYKVDDPGDALSARLIDSQDLAPGSTATSIELSESGGLYRVEVHVQDQAGNDSQSSLLLTVASTGGCAVGGESSSASFLLLLALGFLSLRRRKY